MSACCQSPFDEHTDADSRSTEPAVQSLGQRIAVALLLTYKFALSPILPSSCKFYPTCSAYAREAVERHGVASGLWLTVKRLLRCRPFSPGGVDLVPERLSPDA